MCVINKDFNTIFTNLTAISEKTLKNMRKIPSSYQAEAGKIPVKAYMIQRTLTRKRKQLKPQQYQAMFQHQAQEGEAEKGERNETFLSGTKDWQMIQ